MDEHESKFDVFLGLNLGYEFFQWARKIENGLKKSQNLLGTHWHKIRFLGTCWVFYGLDRVWEAKKKLEIFLAWGEKKPCQVLGNIFVNNFVIDFDFPTRLLHGYIWVWSFIFKRVFFQNFLWLQGPPGPPYTTAGGVLGVQIEAMTHLRRLELFRSSWVHSSRRYWPHSDL